LALGVGLDARPVGRGRLAAVAAVRAKPGSQRRVLGLQRRHLGRKLGHELDDKLDDRIGALRIGFHRDTKQFAGLEACQCWVDQAMVRHVGLVLLTFVVLQMLRLNPEESVGAVKERWQLEVARDGEQMPAPLKPCPAHLRVTA